MEHLFVGHPKGAIHIPWMDEPDWTIDPNFVRRVRELMLGGAMDSTGEAAPVVLICRSGQRTVDAGHLLAENGFDQVYNVLEGFEGNLDSNHQRGTTGGWRFHGLPWEQC
jgi:rhodanese-related sulfurtransferase